MDSNALDNATKLCAEALISRDSKMNSKRLTNVEKHPTGIDWPVFPIISQIRLTRHYCV